MDINLNFITILFLAATLLGVVSSLLIFYFGSKGNPANQALAIGQLCISLAIFVGFSQVSKLILYWPFMYRMGHVFALAFIPMPYLHMVFYMKKRPWKWYDLLHAIPLLIFLIDYGHVLAMSNAEKLAILKTEVLDLNVLGQFRQSRFLGPRIHQESRTALLSAYWVAEVIMLRKWIRRNPSPSPQDRIWKNWILLFLCCQFFMWFPFYLSLFGLDIMATYHITNSFSVLWLMISSLSLFFFPSLLYGNTWRNQLTETKAVKPTRKIPPTGEEEKKLEEVMQLITAQMAQKKLFLTPGYSINDCSRDLETPVYQLSKSLTRFQGVGFVDYVNHQRISYCADQFDQGEWLNLTLEGVAQNCGFNNRNSFTKWFQKFKGCSPSEYRDARTSPGVPGNKA